MPIIGPVSDPWVCSVCGTVNMAVYARCLACGTQRAAKGDTRPGANAPSDTATADRPPADDVDEIDDSALRATIIESPARAPASAPRHGPAPTRDMEDATDEQDPIKFVVRILLPEGDRRTVEVGSRPMVIGSGVDELGLTGDPRLQRAEATLCVEGGRLCVDTIPDAAGIYRRIRDEEYLSDDDVVLLGDIAARFHHLPPGEPVDGGRQVLGGGANAACGRLTFLRRDGSDGPVHDLPAGKTILGRTDGHVNFPNDSRLSRRHARFFASDQGVTIEDLDSRNGTYLRVRGKRHLEIGDALRVGSAGIQIRSRN